MAMVTRKAAKALKANPGRIAWIPGRQSCGAGKCLCRSRFFWLGRAAQPDPPKQLRVEQLRTTVSEQW